METKQLYVKETPILNYSDPRIQDLIEEKIWRNLNDEEKIKAIYNFVRDDIKFGYNLSDNLSARRLCLWHCCER